MFVMTVASSDSRDDRCLHVMTVASSDSQACPCDWDSYGIPWETSHGMGQA